jgi:dsDNA-specific endonuclease/ATPase MutS2
MIEASLKKLEFHKVLEMLAAMAGSNQGKEIALALKPSNKLKTAQYWQKETS